MDDNEASISVANLDEREKAESQLKTQKKGTPHNRASQP